MQNDYDRLQERLSALEAGQVASRSSPSGAARMQRPRLKVVELGPEAPEAAAAPEGGPAPASEWSSDAASAEVSRIVIRGTGDKIVSTEIESPAPARRSPPSGPPLRGAP